MRQALAFRVLGDPFEKSSLPERQQKWDLFPNAAKQSYAGTGQGSPQQTHPLFLDKTLLVVFRCLPHPRPEMQ